SESTGLRQLDLAKQLRRGQTAPPNQPGPTSPPVTEATRPTDQPIAASIELRSQLAAVFLPPFRFHSFLEAIMKAILSAGLVLGFCGLASADDDKKDEKKKPVGPVGVWKCEYQIGEMKRTSELTVKKDGDKFAGTMNWPDQKNEKLTEMKFKDG